MFNFFQKCTGCRKRRFFIKKRKLNIHQISSSPVTSKDKLCRVCYYKLKRLENV